MLADGTDAMLCYEPPLTESEGEYSAHELADRREAFEKKKPVKASKGISKKKSKKESNRFRMRAKRFSITFPQNTTSKTEAEARINGMWDEISYVVAQETHEDGNKHLHIYLEFNEIKSFSDPKCFDFIGNMHGNYQVTKSRRDWVKYIIKEDKEYAAKGIDVKALLNKKACKGKTLVDMIDAGKSIEEVRKEDNFFFCINKKKLEDYGAYMSIIHQREKLEEWKEPDWINLTGSNRKIGKWLAENIRRSRQFKAPQLFIHGPPNHGKTSLIEYLKKSLSVYHIPTTEDFYDAFDNDYDLCVIDEFKGQKSIQWLNQFLDGQTMTMRKKGSQYLKTKNIPTMILSNYAPRDCYEGIKKAEAEAAEKGYTIADKLEPLMARLKVVEVKEFIKIYN